MRFLTFIAAAFLSFGTGPSAYADHGDPNDPSGNKRPTAPPKKSREEILNEERELLAWQTRAFKLYALEYRSRQEAREYLRKEIDKKSFTIRKRAPEIQPAYQRFIEELDDFRKRLTEGSVNYEESARDFIGIIRDAVLSNEPGITDAKLKEAIEDTSLSRYEGVNSRMRREITRQLAAGPLRNSYGRTESRSPVSQTRGSGDTPVRPGLASAAPFAPKPILPPVAVLAPVAVSSPVAASPTPSSVPAGNRLLPGTRVSIPNGTFSPGTTFQIEGRRYRVLPDGTYRRI